MDVKIIQKILQQQKQVSIFLLDIRCQQFGGLIIQKTSILYIAEECMKKFCDSLKEHAKDIIDFEKRKMLPLTKEELKPHKNAKECYICGKGIQKILNI